MTKSDRHFATFETAIGWCGIVWSERGVAGVQLPEPDRAKTRARLLKRFPDAVEAAPHEDVRPAIDGIIRLLDGEAADLSAIPLDLERVPEFNRRVYDIARTIPPGGILSYGEIAARLGDASAARDVGEAMGKNPVAIIIPCHRVVAAGGKLGGFSANGGIATKRRLLGIEGAHARGEATLFG